MLSEQDQIRFMRLWTAAQPAVSAYVHALVWDHAAAEDVLQEISIVLFRRFGEYIEDLPFVAWALGIAKFQVLGVMRDHARNRVIFDDELLARFTQSWAELSPLVSDRSAALEDCLQQLASNARHLVQLRYIDGKTAEQIAHQFGRTGAAVRVAIQRIRQQLRECVGRKLRLEGEAI